MAHLALVCPPTPGHLNPCAVLGRALIRRGHRVTLFQIPPVAEAAKAEGLEFHPIGNTAIGNTERNELARAMRSMAALRGLAAVRLAIECSCRISDLLCRELPQALVRNGVDAVLADQNEPAAACVAESLRLPFVSVCAGLPLNREPAIPPPFFGWAYRDSATARWRNRAGMLIADRLIAPVNCTLNRHRQTWGLAPVRAPDDSFSRAAQLCQMTPDFDFPRKRPPEGFHYLGPFVDTAGRAIAFPYEKLNGRPLVYVSLGTLHDAAGDFFRIIGRACGELGLQPVIAAGGSAPATLRDLGGSAFVVPYAPQLELLARAVLTITHAGLNTVMQSLLFGVPMVAIPMAHDQPATAARIARSGTGEVVPPRNFTGERVGAAIRRVLDDPDYRERAVRIRESIRSAGGAEKGADIVEQVVSKDKRARCTTAS